MRRKRVTGRFYVFLVLLLIAGYFILREIFPTAAREAVVTLGNATYERTVEAVIVRDEEVAGYEAAGRVVFVAAEGARLNEGDLVCEVYSTGYSDKELIRLETARESIRSYHEQILDNIVDTQLEQLEQKVETTAEQLKTLIRQKSGGSLLNLEKQLEEAMVARQDYLRRNQRSDQKLIDLYNDETKRINAIASWQTKALAPRSGVVSFYLDGYENILKVGTLQTLTFDDVRQVIAGRKPTSAGVSNRLVTNIFRMVSSDKWYIVLLSNDPTWNPVTGQQITFQMAGFPDVGYTGTVVRAQKSGSEVMAQLEIKGELGPLMNQRSGKALVGASLTGMMVPDKAVVEQSGQKGVLLSDVPGSETFIPVEVLSIDPHKGYALVNPLAEGSLSVGQRVLIK